MTTRSHLWRRVALCAVVAVAVSACASDSSGPIVCYAGGPPRLIVLTDSAAGRIISVERATLKTVAIVTPPGAPAASAAPMLATMSSGEMTLVGNFGGGVGVVSRDGGLLRVIQTGGAVIGMSFSPDGHTLAANGATDLTLRLIDLGSDEIGGDLSAAWTTRSVPFGKAADAPRHSHMTHGLASTHPFWLADSSAVLTQDNIHEEVVLVSRLGTIMARRAMRSAVHSWLATPYGTVLALCEGTVDGTVAPHVAELTLPSLGLIRELIVPLDADESAKLHHGAVSNDGLTVVVANMGALHGGKPGHTVAAFHLATGGLLWRARAGDNAGHVVFLDAKRIAVLGHGSPDVMLFDAATGAHLETWTVPDCERLGHALEVEHDGSLLVIDATNGRVVRFRDGKVLAMSESFGPGVSEASLRE